MLKEKDYCDYDTCVALKELGYNEKSNWWFNKFLNEDSGQMELVHICDNPAHLNYDSWGIVPKDFVIRPSLYEAQKWLREEKEFYVFVGREWENAYYYWLSKKIDDKTVGITLSFYYSNGEGRFSSYEEALMEGIKEAVKILKEESK